MSNGMTPKEAGILGGFAAIASIGLWFGAEHIEDEFIDDVEIVKPSAIEQPYKDWDDE